MKKMIAAIVAVFLLFNMVICNFVVFSNENKAFPKGIYSLFRGDRVDLPFNNLETKKSWGNENVSGICLRSFWDKVEPFEGKFDFSHFKDGLALGKKYGKKVAVSIAAGDSTPDWVYVKGAKAFLQDWGKNGKISKFPLVWDDVFITQWTNLISELGNQIDNDPALSYVSVGGLGRYVETFYCNNTEDYARFKEIGGVDYYLAGAKRIIDAYAKAFKSTPIYLALGSPWRGVGAEQAINDLVDYTLSTYPGRFGLMSHALNAKSDEDYYINSILVKNSQKAPVGFQMLWASNSAGETAKSIHGTLAQALQKGVDLKTNYIEVYEADIDQTQYATDLKKYNALLIGSNANSVSKAEDANVLPKDSMEGFVVKGDPQSTGGATWTYKATWKGIAYDLTGSIQKPIGNGPFPAVVLSHGKGGTAQNIMRNIGSVMVKWGVVIISVNYTHAMEEFAQGLPGDFAEEDFGASDANILRAKKCLDILETLSYVDKSRIAAHGHSMGAFLTGGLVGTYPDKFLVASHTAGGAGANDRNTKYNTKMAQVEKIKAPYLLQHGDEDNVVNISLAQNMYDTLKKNGVDTELIVQQGVGHADIASSEVTMANIKLWYEKYGLFNSKKIVVLTLGDENAIINGKSVSIDNENPVTPIIENGRALVPARFIAQAFGATVDFLDNTVIIKYKDKISRIKLGEKILTVGDRIIILDVEAKTMNSRTLLPLRAICEEILDKTVIYENGVITVLDKEV